MASYDSYASEYYSSWNDTEYEINAPPNFPSLILAVFGVLLNSLHVFLACRISRRRQTSIARHSIAVGITSVVFLFLCIIARQVFPNFEIEDIGVCRFYNFVEIISQCIVISMLMLISVDNYCVVKKVTRRHTFIARHFCGLLLCVLLVSSLIALPVLVRSKLYQMNGNNKSICMGLDLTSTFAKHYEIVRACFTYAIPLVVIGVVHGKMAYILVKSERNIANLSIRGRRERWNGHIASRRRLRIVVLLLVLLFSICNFPTTLALILNQYNLQPSSFFQFISGFHIYFMLSYAILHPLIVIISTRSIRGELFITFSSSSKRNSVKYLSPTNKEWEMS
ncbi:galanin receptor type 1-like [Anneissia japonica]|uniref:galanin receptor type 1-like n=1 Tax=Anneissia japonica TaxID=1529436 RepID=UPI0014256C89|nr:galanin receptor type 1-like [Anneissia japonica]